MRVVQFTIPVAKEHAVIVQEDRMPHFYNHLHRHNETQITWILQGEGTLVAGNYMQQFRPGDIYVLGANLPHVFKSDPAYFDKHGKTEIHALTIFFNPDGFFQSILALPEAKGIKKFVESTGYGLQVPAAWQERIGAEMLNIQRQEQGFRLAGCIQLLQMLAEVKTWKPSPRYRPVIVIRMWKGCA